MRKLIFGIILFVSVMAFTVGFAVNGQDESNLHISDFSEKNDPLFITFKLPSSLEVIEDESFEGTAITCIELPESLKIIGERAFANVTRLREIRIPISTTSISKSAFTGSINVTIKAAPNSYARTWANENRLPFSPITVMYAGSGGQSVTVSLFSASKEILDTEPSETQETNRTWRKLEESQVRDTIYIIANVIQGRAPPMA